MGTFPSPTDCTVTSGRGAGKQRVGSEDIRLLAQL